MSKFKDVRVLFFAPHADDIEMGAPFMCLEALRLGNHVTEALSTNDEYGTSNLNFKGERIKRIRIYEMNRAAEVYKKYTGNQINLIWAGFIDGFLPLNKISLNFVMKIIRKEKPDIIFAPDPWYAIDFHRDHLNTARLVYFALKRLKKHELPKRVFLFYSFKTNISIRIRFKDVKIAIESMSQHKSQISPLHSKLLLFFRRIFLIHKFIKTGVFSVRFRELRFIDGKPEKHKPIKSIREKLRYCFFFKLVNHPCEELYTPLPEELGLIRKFQKN